MTKLIITGSKGQMGQALIACAARNPELRVVGLVDLATTFAISSKPQMWLWISAFTRPQRKSPPSAPGITRVWSLARPVIRRKRRPRHSKPGGADPNRVVV